MERVKRVLVIDDDPCLARVTAALLDELGLEGVPCTSMDTAWRTLSGESRPDLVLLDVQMPGVTPTELCDFVRASCLPEGVPVVLVSGVVEEDLRWMADVAGAEGYVAKPFGMVDARAVEARHLN